MSLYHFDVRYDGRAWEDDDVGCECADGEEARTQALGLAFSLAKEHPPATEIAIRVRDGEPEPILMVRVSTEIEHRG
jgi:hypothetical protein